jgi:nucleotide-binding universal stress UspA family protein
LKRGSRLARSGGLFPTRILLATDGSNEAVLAEDAAVEISGSTGSELHVVHVVLIVFDLPYPRGSLRERNEAVLDRRKIRGLRLLEERVRRIEDLGGAVAASHYREGNPKKEVLRLASELDAGLIITGGQRRPWFERIFGDGFSEHVFKRAERPVLVVSDRERESSALPR